MVIAQEQDIIKLSFRNKVLFDSKMTLVKMFASPRKHPSNTT
jgi:hypothetical protein